PGMDPADGRLVSSVLWAAITGQPFRVHGDGLQQRTLSYVDDTVSGLLAVMERGRPVELASDVTGCPVAVEHAPPQDEDDPRQRCPNLARLLAMGWVPRTSLMDG